MTYLSFTFLQNKKNMPEERKRDGDRALGKEMGWRNRADEEHQSADRGVDKVVSRQLFMYRYGSSDGPYHTSSSLKLSA